MKLIIADNFDLPGIDYLMVAQSSEPVLLCMPSPPQHILSTYDKASHLSFDPQKWQSFEVLGRMIDEKGWQFSQVFITLASTYCRFVDEFFSSHPQVYDCLYLVDSLWPSRDNQLVLQQLERWQLVTAPDHESLEKRMLDLLCW